MGGAPDVGGGAEVVTDVEEVAVLAGAGLTVEVVCAGADVVVEDDVVMLQDNDSSRKHRIKIDVPISNRFFIFLLLKLFSFTAF